jgi:CTP synthase (UTP-ammonia lyase)
MPKQIAIAGDFHNSKTQVAISLSIEHAARLLGVETSCKWLETNELANDYAEILGDYSGIWSASGSPFKSFNGALNAIRFARENNIPHLGTCGGFQHSVLEYARNVLGFTNADHAEYNPIADDLFIDKLTCSLVGTRGKVFLTDDSLAKNIFSEPKITVDYYCSYGINDRFKSIITQKDLKISGVDINNCIRMMELRNHPFFIITAFVPQVDSSFDNPNKLVLEFVKKVNNIN